MTSQATHSVELRQNGEIVAIVAADFCGNALELNLLRSLDGSGGPCGVYLDVYEGDTQLQFNAEYTENGAAIFRDANRKARLVLRPGKFGSVRVDIVDISESSISSRVRLKPLSVN